MAVSVYTLVVCWQNSSIYVQLSLLRYENDEIDQSSIIPIIDGGTEGEFVLLTAGAWCEKKAVVYDICPIHSMY